MWINSINIKGAPPRSPGFSYPWIWISCSGPYICAWTPKSIPWCAPCIIAPALLADSGGLVCKLLKRSLLEPGWVFLYHMNSLAHSYSRWIYQDKCISTQFPSSTNPSRTLSQWGAGQFLSSLGRIPWRTPGRNLVVARSCFPFRSTLRWRFFCGQFFSIRFLFSRDILITSLWL